MRAQGVLIGQQQRAIRVRAMRNNRKSHIPFSVPTMPKARKKAVAASVSADEIEAAFYDALQMGDLDKLMACWADEEDVVCVHPGGPRLLGLGAIRAAFDAMFSNGTVRAWPEAVHKIESLASSVHSVRERIEVLTEDGPRHAYVIATNVYQNTAQGWRMVAHHASPGTQGQASEVNQPPQTLH